MSARQKVTMKSHANYLFVSLCVAGLSGLQSPAATVWSGPLITYTQPASDPTQAANRDQLTASVSLTRAALSGMFNGVSETFYTHNVSPADTEWAVGFLTNYATLTYASWEVAGSGHPVFNLPGKQLVVHLISDDIYLSLQFTSLGGQGSGGFSYIRSTPGSANVPPTVAITSPANNATFTAPAVVPIAASASDSDGSVTNVQFFDGSTLLGATNNMPYTITANLAPGSHALSSVAADNGGLSTTSSVVNVTVISSRPSLTIQLTGDLLDISWPEAGGHLQAQTNGLAGSWMDVPNSTTTNRIVAPIDRLNGSVYYRLAP